MTENVSESMMDFPTIFVMIHNLQKIS